MKTKRFFWVLIALLIVGSLVLSACGAKPTEETVVDESTTGEGTYYERAMAGEFAGTVVTMTGPFTDEDAVKFDATVAAFEEATGIDIQYEGSKEFEATITIRVEAGDAPDIVDFPQPGLLKTMVAKGAVVDVSTFLPQSSFDNYNQSWWDMATMAGPDGDITAGVWHRFNAKSQIWYPKDDFDAAGYAIPETWDEMVALADQIVADGDKPWCVGFESGAATGWAATDWMEDVMLRTTSLENYDKWTNGELKFSSPEVKNALQVLSDLWAEEYVLGGSEAIVTTFFGDAPAPMFEDPPKCWLHKQGNFVTSFFPEDAVAGVDYGYFYLPPLDEAYGRPYLVAGDIMAMFSDRDEVRAVMEFFTMGEAVKEWLAAGGALSPHMDASLDWYGDDVEKGIAGLVADATSVRFDGSDLMPGQVGAGSFWVGMTDFFSGTTDIDTVLAEIDASWPVKLAEGDLGTETNPIVWAVVPSGETEEVVSGFNEVADMLLAKTGIYIEPFVATEYAGVIEAMCSDPPKAQMSSLATFSYVLGAEKGCAEAALIATRYGSPVYNGQIFARADSGIETLADLEGKTFCRPDPLSTSGWIAPSIALRAAGLDPDTAFAEVVDAGSHDASVAGVYDGTCDAGSSYVDARGTIEEDNPDVMDVLVVIEISDDIPNDGVQFVPGFDADLKGNIIGGLKAIAATEEGQDAMDTAYEWTAFIEADDAFYDSFRQWLDAAGVVIE